MSRNHIGTITHGQARVGGKSPLGLVELVAIAVGGMVGGGIFSVLGVAVDNIGYATIYALIIGGALALLSVYGYAKLARYYQDEGATYAFIKRTYPGSRAAPSIVGWVVTFGYISTMALYANTFGSYFASALNLSQGYGAKLAATGLLLLFAAINLVSVRGMGVVEDILVYTKLIAIALISVLFLLHAKHDVVTPLLHPASYNALDVLMISALTFVAYEGFQLTINAFKDVADPIRNVPRSMYIAIVVVIIVYVVLALGALSALSLRSIIDGKEFALAAGAKTAVGSIGYLAVIMSALFATTSALSGTLYGASRLVSVISHDGYMPRSLSRRTAAGIPRLSIIAITSMAFLLLISGTLQKILEFGSFTFMLTSLLVAVACYRVRVKAEASRFILLLSIAGLGIGLLLLTYFQFTREPQTLLYTFGIYALVGLAAYYYARSSRRASAILLG